MPLDRTLDMIIWEKYGDEHQKAYKNMMDNGDNTEYVHILLKEQAMREELENAGY